MKTREQFKKQEILEKLEENRLPAINHITSELLKQKASKPSALLVSAVLTIQPVPKQKFLKTKLNRVHVASFSDYEMLLYTTSARFVVDKYE